MFHGRLTVPYNNNDPDKSAAIPFLSGFSTPEAGPSMVDRIRAATTGGLTGAAMGTAGTYAPGR
jgi:hypothetical protein